MKGRIMAVTGGRRVRCCADTGCSVNIMPAKIAASGGLTWREPDWDKHSYKSVPNFFMVLIFILFCYIKYKFVVMLLKISKNDE